jgi:hypothetical protein
LKKIKIFNSKKWLDDLLSRIEYQSKRLRIAFLDSEGEEGQEQKQKKTSLNWEMINNVISENDGDPWYIPKDDIVNAWTSPISLTVGNIDLRDFKLERKFADIGMNALQIMRRSIGKGGIKE